MKAFCLVCLNFLREDWCMGYCRIRKEYVHKPFKNCRTYKPTPNVEDDPTFLLQWYNRAFELAKIKREYVYLFFELETPEAKQ